MLGRRSTQGPWAQCVKCGDYIRSTHRHDYITCFCGAISIDGGAAYTRCVGNFGDFRWPNVSGTCTKHRIPDLHCNVCYLPTKPRKGDRGSNAA